MNKILFILHKPFNTIVSCYLESPDICLNIKSYGCPGTFTLEKNFSHLNRKQRDNLPVHQIHYHTMKFASCSPLNIFSFQQFFQLFYNLFLTSYSDIYNKTHCSTNIPDNITYISLLKTPVTLTILRVVKLNHIGSRPEQ